MGRVLWKLFFPPKLIKVDVKVRRILIEIFLFNPKAIKEEYLKLKNLGVRVEVECNYLRAIEKSINDKQFFFYIIQIQL